MKLVIKKIDAIPQIVVSVIFPHRALSIILLVLPSLSLPAGVANPARILVKITESRELPRKTLLDLLIPLRQ